MCDVFWYRYWALRSPVICHFGSSGAKARPGHRLSLVRIFKQEFNNILVPIMQALFPGNFERFPRSFHGMELGLCEFPTASYAHRGSYETYRKYRNIFVCLEVVHAKRCYAIYCFVLIFYCISRSSLADLTSRPAQLLPLKMAFVGRCFGLLDLQKRHAHFSNLEDVRMTF